MRFSDLLTKIESALQMTRDRMDEISIATPEEDIIADLTLTLASVRGDVIRLLNTDTYANYVPDADTVVLALTANELRTIATELECRSIAYNDRALSDRPNHDFWSRQTDTVKALRSKLNRLIGDA